jgi:hypothetical protein
METIESFWLPCPGSNFLLKKTEISPDIYL